MNNMCNVNAPSCKSLSRGSGDGEKGCVNVTHSVISQECVVEGSVGGAVSC